jgi:hypothetical protein
LYVVKKYFRLKSFIYLLIDPQQRFPSGRILRTWKGTAPVGVHQKLSKRGAQQEDGSGLSV